METPGRIVPGSDRAPVSLQGHTARVTEQPLSPPHWGQSGSWSHHRRSGPASGILGVKNQPHR